MKRLLFCSMALLSFTLILSCNSAPQETVTPSAAAPAENTAAAEPAEAVPPVTTNEPTVTESVVYAPDESEPVQVNEQLREIFDRHIHGLILDGAEHYIVVPGDTLARISYAKYRNGFFFPIIMLASSDIVADFDEIYPGMDLIIPDLQANLDDPEARRNIKTFLLYIADLEESRNRYQDAVGLRALSNSL